MRSAVDEDLSAVDPELQLDLADRLNLGHLAIREALLLSLR